MIRHTKLVLLLSIIVIVFSCKKEQNNKHKLPTNSNVIFSDIKPNSGLNNTYQYFTSFKIKNNYDSSDKNITDKFRNLTFNFINDTIVKVKGQEALYRNTILAKKYFGHEYLYKFYSNCLHDKLDIDLPQNIESVRNKNLHSKQSILYDLFKEGFFVKEKFIFEYDGNIIIFQNQEIVIKTNKKTVITLPFSEEDFEYSQKSYPYISKNKYKKIQNLIITQNPENSEIDRIIQINNKMDFDTYVYFLNSTNKRNFSI